MPAPIIAFVGPDGSGKSTQAKLAADALRQQGLRVRLVYGRVVPILSRPLIWLNRLRPRRERAKPAESRSPARPLRGAAAAVFSIAYRLDMAIQGFAKFRLARLHQDVVVCDRYVQDSLLTDFAVQLGWSPERVTQEYRRLVPRRFPEPALTIYLRVPAAVSYQRKTDIPSEAAYRRLVELYHATAFPGPELVIESQLGVEEVHRLVAAALPRATGGAS